ncbi:MAG: glutamine--fructose-6-phosphate transaminase (isomerizing) [Oscillospiraceae bacterium]|nr:glutamine--fructose-6-phosphate transaminase (isomerizing) [Oscillospiraceae bacterium]
MCGIIGYVGQSQAAECLLHGLGCLEYRGYDSAGISVFEQDGITTVKTKGRVADLAAALKSQPVNSKCGIAHTRWATHGVPSDVNAHPHATEKLSLVHNGIIENYMELKEMLKNQGVSFVSQTDTEVVARLLDLYYEGDPMAAIKKTLEKIEGSYALGILFRDFPNRVYGVRKGSPLIAAVSDDGSFLASDIPAVLAYTRKYYLMEEGEICLLSEDDVKFFNFDGEAVEKQLLTSALTLQQAEKGGYEHFMLKEIYEQPTALRSTLSPRISNGMPCFVRDGIHDGFFEEFDRLHIVACGSAYYAGCVGKHLLGKFGRLPVEMQIASEFRYCEPVLDKRDLVIIISQSGETADSLAALRYAKAKGIKTLAIVNVAASSIAREADYVIYTYAGPEIAVATTKGFAVQVGVLYLLSFQWALARKTADADTVKANVAALLDTVDKLEEAFKLNESCERIAKTLVDAQSMFYIGRGQDYSMSLEGALKLKEISYIHCEAYAAGELKHGTISLITEGTPVIAMVTDNRLAAKTISNVEEVKARGGRIIAICTEQNIPSGDAYDELIVLPKTEEAFAPLLAIVPLQLLAYHTACAKGCDVDKPRNLAKSVTVE